MPFINVKTNVNLNDENKHSLMQKLTKSITIIPGKTEAHLMCGVDGSYCYVKFEEIENWGMDGYMF